MPHPRHTVATLLHNGATVAEDVDAGAWFRAYPYIDAIEPGDLVETGEAWVGHVDLPPGDLRSRVIEAARRKEAVEIEVAELAALSAVKAEAA